MSDINPYLEIARLIAASICGALSGALVAHKLTVSRERAAGIRERQRGFLSFLSGWLATVGREWPPKEDIGPELQRRAAAIRTDFRDPGQFDILVSAAFALTGAGAEKPNAWKDSPKAIEALIRYVSDA